MIDVRINLKHCEIMHVQKLINLVIFLFLGNQLFYVYCRHVCKKVQKAKMRARCNKCNFGNIGEFRVILTHIATGFSLFHNYCCFIND